MSEIVPASYNIQLLSIYTNITLYFFHIYQHQPIFFLQLKKSKTTNEKTDNDSPLVSSSSDDDGESSKKEAKVKAKEKVRS